MELHSQVFPQCCLSLLCVSSCPIQTAVSCSNMLNGSNQTHGCIEGILSLATGRWGWFSPGIPVVRRCRTVRWAQPSSHHAHLNAPVRVTNAAEVTSGQELMEQG